MNMTTPAIDRRITTRLTFAVLLTDDFTGKQEIMGNVTVSVPDLERTAVANPSGYFTFLDLPDVPGGEYTVRVDAGFYVESQTAVKPTDLDPDAPVVTIALKPNPLYPFPSGATLMRGVVSRAGGSAAAGAGVQWEGDVVKSTVTSGKGEFVLYFPVDFFPVDGESASITVDVTPPGESSVAINTEVYKCKTTSLPVVI